MCRPEKIMLSRNGFLSKCMRDDKEGVGGWRWGWGLVCMFS